MLLVLVVLGRFHAVTRVVPRQPQGVDLVIISRLESVHFLLSEGRMPNALDTVVELTMNTSTRNADKCSHGQVDALWESGSTVGALFVGRVSL